MRIGTLGLCAFALAFCGSTRPAAAEVTWSSDATLSKATLTVPYLFLSKINALIPIESGTIVTSDASTTPLLVDLRLSSAALTTGDAKRDVELRSDHFFDVERYPT